MGIEVVIVQHGEKQREPGDPGLSPLGRAQANQVARWIVEHFEVTAVWSSPLRRAVETAAPLAATLGIEVTRDPRLRERMNWEGDHIQSMEDFLAEWQAATRDRTYAPECGDSSERAAARFISALGDIAAGLRSDTTAAVFTHGGVTVDALRTIAGDDHLMGARPELLSDGVPCGAITTLERVSGRWKILQLPLMPIDAQSSGQGARSQRRRRSRRGSGKRRLRRHT